MQVVFINAGSDSFATTFYAGKLIPMKNVSSASGAVYAQSNVKKGYELATKGTNADLYDSSENIVLRDCTAIN